MKGVAVVAVLFIVWSGSIGQRSLSAAALPRHSLPLQSAGASLQSSSSLPISFEVNRGQVDRQVTFLAHGRGYTLFLTSTGAVFTFTRRVRTSVRQPLLPGRFPWVALATGSRATADVVRLRFLGAGSHPHPIGLRRLPGTVNYFLGNDPRDWHTNIPTYAAVEEQNVYPGIDLLFYGSHGSLEYDWLIIPGANPRSIRLAVSGGQRLRVDRRGDLAIRTSTGLLLQKAPGVYQEVKGMRRQVAARYVLQSPNRVGFRLGAYDRHRPLTIDPALVYSTYLGGNDWDEATSVAVDAAGNAYVAGWTESPNFPTANAVQQTFGGGTCFDIPCHDAFVSKLSSSGKTLLYSTYLGGNMDDAAEAIALDGSGNTYVTGFTESANFPTAHALQPTSRGGTCPFGTITPPCADAFVAKLNAAGNTLVYSTYLGGSRDDGASGVAVDGAGDAYVAGWTRSPDFPTSHALQAGYHGGTCSVPISSSATATVPCADAFVAELDPSGSTLLFSTYFGGSRDDFTAGIALDTSQNIYFAGTTDSADFSTSHALQARYGGGQCKAEGSVFPCDDAFLAKLSAGGGSLLYSTYLGGNDEDAASAFTIDGQGNVYVAGSTSSADFPTVHPLRSKVHATGDGFIAKLNAAGSALIYSTYFGGSQGDDPAGIAVDKASEAYLTGTTYSKDFPTRNAFQPHYAGGKYGDAFVTKISAAGNALVYSSYLGGRGDDAGSSIAVDSANNAYVVGNTSSQNFPTKQAFQATFRGDIATGFVTKVSSTVKKSKAKTCKKGYKRVRGKCVKGK